MCTGVAVVALAWFPHQSRWNTTLVLLAWLTDRRGRRSIFTWSPLGHMAGSTLISQSAHLYGTLTGALCLLVTAGIDANTLLAYSASRLNGLTQLCQFRQHRVRHLSSVREANSIKRDYLHHTVHPVAISPCATPNHERVVSIGKWTATASPRCRSPRSRHFGSPLRQALPRPTPPVFPC